MITPHDTPDVAPFAAMALDLFDRRWSPIPVRGKDRPPAGFTGRTGAYPSWADIQSWLDGPEADSNIAIRLPDTVVGIDVDAHSGKSGASTMDALIARWGPLQPTWRSTSRDDGVSGIYLYRVPPGTDMSRAEKAIRVIGEHVDVIRWDHRYVMVAPSVHPDTGQPYRWFGPSGVECVAPSIRDLS